MTETAQDQTAITPSNHDKKLRFVKALKQFNVKERHFLMRYALSETLSDDFVQDLIKRLQDIGLSKLQGAKAIYWGMDYHFEWINASLLLATGDLNLKENGKSELKEGVLAARIEDVDLMVVLEKSDASMVLVLIEAKGVTPFGNEQFVSKINRLREVRVSAGTQGEWLETIMLVMSPEMSRPSLATRQSFVDQLKGVEFWPSNVPGNEAQLVWMELKHFVKDLKNEEGQAIALQVRTCTDEGKPAKNAQAKKDTPYKHWQIESRHIDVKKRSEQ